MSTVASRRTVLRAGLAAAASGALAACGHDSTPPSASPSTTASATASTTALAALTAQLPGRLERPGDAGWNPSALLHNSRFAALAPPLAIARCSSEADVAACVRYAAGGNEIRMHAGGHSYTGASGGPGVVVDLSAMSSVTVDTAARTATVGAGAVLVDVYAAVAARGLALGAGSCPSVSISGLTLGGGVGVLGPSFGLACDQLLSARVVTADSTAVTVSADEHPDLFWALRGGGGGFAAVVEWTFALRPAPAVTTFSLTWPWSAAADVLAAWQAWAGAGPRELWSSCRLLADPGTGLRVVVGGTWTGAGSLDTVLAGLLTDLPAPTSRSAAPHAYAAAMLTEAGCSALDAGACRAKADAPAGRVPFAATSSILAQPLPAAGVAAAVAAVAGGMDARGLVEGGMAFDVLGGAIADVPAAGTAVPWRSALATVQHTATWSVSRASADPAPYDALVHTQRQALAPWCGSAAYLNYADAGLDHPAQACWGANLPRLQRVRAAADPHGVFSSPLAVPLG